MALYQKYRPSDFNQIVGNQAVVDAFKVVLKKKDIPHTYLFTGESGCGKTTFARILAKKLGAKGMDFREIDTADFRGIDTVREIRKQSSYAPVEGQVRVFLIDECHKLTNDAQNALLKLLEDSPSHSYYILATTEPNKLLKTIKGRAVLFEVKPLNELQMESLLKGIIKAEKKKVKGVVLEQIFIESFGQPRNAIQILEKIIDLPKKEQLKVVKEVATKQSESIALCRALLDNSNWKKVSIILKGLKAEDPEYIRRHVLGYAQSVLLNRANDRAALIIEEFADSFWQVGFAGLVYACYSVVNN